MSTGIVEFSFKGSISDLASLLGGLVATRPAVAGVHRVVEAQVMDAEIEPHPMDHLSSAVPDIDNMSVEQGMLRTPEFDFDKIPLDPEAWVAFVEMIREWQVGFKTTDVAQPNRVETLKGIGVGRWPIFVLRWIAHYKCLQEAVFQAMDNKDLDRADDIAMTIVQVSHSSFPDIADFYDNSTRWRRSKNA